MKAIVWTGYGPPEVLRLMEREKPVPGKNEVLVRIHAATVTAGDCEMRNLKLPLMLSFPMRLYNGFSKPKRITILGQEFSGVIESSGDDVTLFKAGEEVFGGTGITMGAYAEYICMPQIPKEGVLAPKPVNMTFEEAASVTTGGLEALHFLRKAEISGGQHLLINGAGGSIGTFAVQLAKCFGAEVTAVDTAGKLEMLRSIGADHVVDYNREDFTKSGRSYEVILDVVGKSPYGGSISSLKKNGTYMTANPGFPFMFRGSWTNLRGHRKVIFRSAGRRSEDLLFLKDLIEEGKVRSVIDRSFPLEDVSEAHRYVETGEKRGNVIISIRK